MARRKKHEIITFKVDGGLSERLAGIANRSEFIRAAVLRALGNVCPLCLGTGTMTLDQRRHWQAFAESHHVETCGECEAVHLVCSAEPSVPFHESGGQDG